MDQKIPLITEGVLKSYLYGHKIAVHGRLPLSNYLSVPVPNNIALGVSMIPGCDVGVFASGFIKAGTEIGPYIGRTVSVYEANFYHHNEYCWEIFDKDGHVKGFVDGSALYRWSWLSYIQCARWDQEQNLEVVPEGREIYYRAIKDIYPGEELLVWYGAQCCLYMGIPGIKRRDVKEKKPQADSQKSSAVSMEATRLLEITKQRCIVCRRGFNSKSNLRSHMRIHTQEKPFKCRFCERKFSQSSTLRNHVRLHTGEKPYKCESCKNSYSQLAGLRAHQRSAKHRPHFNDRSNVKQNVMKQ